MLTSSELRNGTVFKYEGRVWLVIKYEFVKTGRGSGTVKVKARDLLSSSIVEKGFNLNQKFEEAAIEKRSAQYLYSDETYGYFMDNVSFEQIQLPVDSVKEQLNFIIEGGKVILVYLDDKPVSVEIPKSVVLIVVYTEPAIKGDTSGNATKVAKLETGLEIRVPMFIQIGDKIKVNTETYEYSERTN